DAINQRLDLLVAAAIGFLPKDQIKSIRARFGFLVRNNIQCVPLNRNDIEVAFWLLHEFLGSYNPKQNFRNTWNDILVLSAAINRGVALYTKDRLLGEFAATVTHTPIIDRKDFLDLKFERSTMTKKDTSDAKGYVNNAWRCRARNLRGYVF